jgi:hypothetical protein
MPVREGGNRSPRRWAGVILLALGTLLMLAQVGWIAVRLEHLANSLQSGATGVYAALSLTVLRLLQTVAFGHAAATCVAVGLLISCVALANILAGLMLLRKRIAETAQ